MTNWTIFHIMQYCLSDGTGIRTTVFLKGCPLRCRWCQNPEGLEGRVEIGFRLDRCLGFGECFRACPNGAIASSGGRFTTIPGACRQCGTCVDACPTEARQRVGWEATAMDVVAEIAKDKVFFDESGGGATFSGGEPLMQHEFLAEILRACRAHNIHTAVETCGEAEPGIIDAIAKLTDILLYDLKSMDPETHRAFTGVDNTRILENLRRLASWHDGIIIRIPLIPGVNDDEENIERSKQFIASLGRVNAVHLLPYHTTGVEKYNRRGMKYQMPHTDPIPGERLAAIVRRLDMPGITIAIGG